MSDGDRVYEMLWDCEYCGTRKLLGKSHRHCPKCGAPQDPARRYFPADDEKIAVVDHVYHGADRTCDACDTANAAAAAFCVNCGAPMEGASEVAADGTPARPQARAAVAAPAPARRSRAALGCAGVGLLALVGVLASLFWTRSESLTVAGHAWERGIAIETFQTVGDSAWCDELPRGARDVTRSRRERSTRQIADGETCETVRVDQRDGTFREEQRCQTRYRSEPVYADHCSFRIDRWTHVRDVKASGSDLAPQWPRSNVQPCQRVGCSREGSRSERYLLELVDGRGGHHQCALPEGRWRSYAPGTHWTTDVGVVTGSLDCDSLRPE